MTWLRAFGKLVSSLTAWLELASASCKIEAVRRIASKYELIRNKITIGLFTVGLSYNIVHFTADNIGLPSLKFFWWAPEFLFISASGAFSAVQGHPRSLILVPIESAYVTSYYSP